MTQFVILKRVDDGDFRDREVVRRGFSCLFTLSNWGVLYFITEDKEVADIFAFKEDGYTKSVEYDVYNMDRESDVTALDNREIDLTLLQQTSGTIATRLTGVTNLVYLNALLDTAKTHGKKRPDVIMFVEGAIAGVVKENKYAEQEEINKSFESRIAALESAMGVEPPAEDTPPANEGETSESAAQTPEDEGDKDEGDPDSAEG